MKATVLSATQPIGKRFSLTADGVLAKSFTNAPATLKAEIVEFSTPAELAKLLDGLTTRQALTWGVAIQPGLLMGADTLARTNAARDFTGRSHSTAKGRNRANFDWPEGGGVLMLDCDRPASAEEFHAAIAALVPLSDVAWLARPSSSSYIFQGDTELHGMCGQRLYIFVKNAADIPRAGQALFERLWLAGHGGIKVSSAGSALVRGLVDAAVFQPERLDYAAGATCEPPLEQRWTPTQTHEGALLDTQAALPCLTKAERTKYDRLVAEAKAAKADELSAARAAWIEKRVTEDLQRQGLTVATHEQRTQAQKTATRALDSGVLTGDYVVQLETGEQVTVQEILKYPAKFHGQRTCDPIEPEYNNGRAVGKFFLMDGVPNLYSFARGGRTFKLIHNPVTILHRPGNIACTVDETLEVLRHSPHFFDYGDALTCIHNAKRVTVKPDVAGYKLGSLIQFIQHSTKGEPREIDPPERLIKAVLGLGTERGLKPLRAVVTAPVITPEGHLISTAGYDAKSEIYLAENGDLPTIPERVTTEDALQAVDRLMRIFAEFPLASELDRTALLCAVLTAVVRHTVETAPAIVFDAPTVGTGKTYLANCLGVLNSGEKPQVFTPITDEDETRKRLLGALLGGTSSLVWDNVLGYFNNTAIAVFLTTDKFTERVLGVTGNPTLPNRILFMMTGNNFQAAGDLPRRTLKIRLDAKMENPTLRTFKSDPVEYIKRHRLEVVCDALTVIRGYLQSDCKANGGAAPDVTASFAQWDELCRQPIAWLASLDGSTWCDPKQVLDEGITADPESEALAELLEALHYKFKGEAFSARDVCGACSTFEPLQEIVGSYVKDINPRSVGKVLRFRKDNIAGGVKLVADRKLGRLQHYRTQEVG